MKRPYPPIIPRPGKTCQAEITATEEKGLLHVSS